MNVGTCKHACYHSTLLHVLLNLKGEPKQLRQPDNFHIASLSPIYIIYMGITRGGGTFVGLED